MVSWEICDPWGPRHPLSERGDTKVTSLQKEKRPVAKLTLASGRTAGNFLTCRQGVLSLSVTFPGFTSLSNGSQLQSHLP